MELNLHENIEKSSLEIQKKKEIFLLSIYKENFLKDMIHLDLRI